MTSASDIPEIVVLREGVEIMRRLLDQSPVRLGKGPDNDVVLHDAELSDQPVEIVEVSGRWWIRCLDNTQRLYVADQTCHAHALSDGDTVGVGPFEVRFSQPQQSVPASDPTDPDEESFLDRTRVIGATDSLDLCADPSAVPALEVPGYDIGREIGRGGMGIVYEAVQISTQRTVALKIMLEGPYTSETTKRRFEREVHIVASLRHPNIAQIFESGLHQGRYWFAMEYVDGQSLDTSELRSSLSMRDRLTLMATVCEAVGHAHERMIVHRDLKPSNILISQDGQPHILDFGLAKVEGPSSDPGQMLSMAGELMGTPAYMSPEQTEADPGKIDARADVYSLGVIFYQFLTGRFPYNVRGRLDQIVHEIATVQATPPSQITKLVDSETEAILLKAIAKDPSERYATATEMGRDIRRLLVGEPVYAKLSSRSYVISKRLRRNRWPLVGAATLVVAVVASVLITRAWLKPSPSASTAEINAPPKGEEISEATVRPFTRRDGEEAGEGDAADRQVTDGSTQASSAATSSPTTASSAPAPTTIPHATKEQQARSWLVKLSRFVEDRDYLRAHLALERLTSCYPDCPAVMRSTDKLKRFAETIDSKLGEGAIRDHRDYTVYSQPASSAEWQAAMTIAQGIVAERDGEGVVVVRIALEDETAERSLKVRGQGLGFFVGTDISSEITARSGDVLFVGSRDRQVDTPTIQVHAEHHHSPTIELRPQPGRVARLGDVIIRMKGG